MPTPDSVFTCDDVALAAMQDTERGYEATIGALAMNITIQEIWKAAPWRNSVAEIPSFHLVPLQQDYGAPQLVLPTDFWKIERAYLYDLNSDMVTPIRELNVMTGLPVDSDGDPYPNTISYELSRNAIRVHPRPPDNVPIPMWLVSGEYKKRWNYTFSSTVYYRLLPQHLQATPMPWADQYFGNVVRVMKWVLATLSNKTSRAGGTTKQGNTTASFGLAGDARAAIEEMVMDERLSMGVDIIRPNEPLVWSQRSALR